MGGGGGGGRGSGREGELRALFRLICGQADLFPFSLRQVRSP